MAFFSNHLTKLIASGIAEKDAVAAGIKSVPATAVAQMLFGRDEDGKGGSVAGDALLIPYFDLQGEEIEGADGMPIQRFRIFDTRSDAEKGDFKTQRYMSRSGAGSALYIPPGLKKLLENNPSFLLITEGEFKALCGVLHAIPCAAIAGVTMWRAEAGKETVDGRIVDLANHIGRVIVLADSDATDNPAVEAAMKQFAAELRKQSNAVVAYASIPNYAAKPKNKKSKASDSENQVEAEKIGLDDWIAKNKHDTSAIVNFLNKKMADEVQRQEIIGNGGYIALGHTDAGSVVWSVPRCSVITIGPNQITSPGTLMQVCGGSWCDAQYADKGKPDFLKIGRDIIDACNAKGAFAERSVRGSGVWRSEDCDTTLVINSGMNIWRTDGRVQPRVGPTSIYSAYTPLGIDQASPAGTVEDAAVVYDALQTWTFKRSSDPFLMFGWICHAYLTGAWDWRSHACLTGVGGTGKSSLQTMCKNLLGSAAVAIDGRTSEPGLRQKIDKNSLAALVDEGEADTSRVAALLNYFRTGSSGAELLMGSQSGSGGHTFNIRSAGLVSAVRLPAFSATDASRFLPFELIGAPKARAARNSVIRDAELARALGVKLFVRMVNAWPRIHRAHAIISEIIEENGSSLRSVDTLAPVLSAGWCAINEGDITEEEARKLIASIDMSDTQKIIESSKNESDVMDHVLGTAIQVDVDGRLERTTIAEACRMALSDGKSSPAEKAIAIYGLKVVMEDDKPRLLINDKAPELVKLFRGTKFEGTALETSFKRIPGASQKRTPKAFYIGGISCKALSLPIDIEIHDLDDTNPPDAMIGSIISRIKG